MQDELTGALIALARAADGKSPGESTHRVVLEGLFSTITNVNFNEETLRAQIAAALRERAALASGRGD